MPGLPYMRLWVGDLMGDPDVQDMSVDELGAYFKLLCRSWQKGCVPSDQAELRRILRVPPRKFDRIWETVGPKWISDGNGGLVNLRQEREREEATKLRRRRAEAGRKGGQSKAKANG